jgi:hypothetical protein
MRQACIHTFLDACSCLCLLRTLLGNVWLLSSILLHFHVDCEIKRTLHAPVSKEMWLVFFATGACKPFLFSIVSCPRSEAVGLIFCTKLYSSCTIRSEDLDGISQGQVSLFHQKSSTNTCAFISSFFRYACKHNTSIMQAF